MIPSKETQLSNGWTRIRDVKTLPPSVIHCHPAIISESLIHFASVRDLAKSITVAPVCVHIGGGGGQGMQRRQVNSLPCCFKALSVL